MPPKPNIVWIVTTQWRAQAMGHAGDPNARTPHLDAFAASSLNFTQAVTPHPFGPFARAALLTGIASPENGVVDYFDPLPPETPTIAHALAAEGYDTAFFGKWHLGRRDPRAPLVGEAHARLEIAPGARGGFAAWEGFESGFQLNDPWLHGSELGPPQQFFGYQSDVVCERAARWLKKYSGNEAGRTTPWFCVVSLEPPHPPYDAPSAGIFPRAPESIVLPANIPRGGPVEARARRELAGYYAHLEATDRAIGRFVGALPDDAIVVFTSVHGDMHGSHGLFRKGWPYEESIRVPLLVRFPPGMRDAMAGGVSSASLSLVDLPALSLNWAAGRLGTIDRAHASISMPSVVRLPLQCDRVWRGLRTSSRKAVWNEDGSPWLYHDLEEDPFERRNLVGDPARRAEFDGLQSLV